MYDLRVDSKEKLMGVAYQAMVQQSSGLDWEKVQLELSTANPHFGGNAPVLSTWAISLTPPQPRFPYGGYQPNVAPCAAPSMMMQQMMVSPATNMFSAPAPPPPPRAPHKPASAEAATVNSSTTSTTFTIAGKQTVRSDNTAVKVSVMQAQLPIHLRYSAVPKLDSHTYLKVKATNTTGFVFLPGKVNTFADNQFVGKSEMDQVAPDAEFWTFLGVDDNITCTRKLAHRKLGEKGSMFSSKKNRVEYKYVFTAKNSRKTSEELVVWDQFPISQDKKITIAVTAPTKEASPEVRFEVNDLNAIEWFWDMKPNATQSFEFVFHVDYPTEERVTGLD
jgi:uncharacterized protein (TIGR02231 family)